MASCPKCGHRPMTKRKSDGRPACPHCGPMPFPGTFAIPSERLVLSETNLNILPKEPSPCPSIPKADTKVLSSKPSPA